MSEHLHYQPRKPSRPVLRYHGGKWRLAPWIVEHLPPHNVYVEPYGGAASVLMRKERSYAEIYNDIESEVVNVFRVLQDPAGAEELKRLLVFTPFARDEFETAYGKPKNDLERAHGMIVRAFMGFGSASMTRKHVTGFRKNSNRSGTTPAQDWAGWPAQIPMFVERLRGVVIENKNALEVIQDHDKEHTLFYVDPPYPWSTRSSLVDRRRPGVKHAYKHEMTDDDHIELSELLHTVKGMVVVSGYPCDLYDKVLYKGWRRLTKKHMADGARSRTEVLWFNDAAWRAQRQLHLS